MRAGAEARWFHKDIATFQKCGWLCCHLTAAAAASCGRVWLQAEQPRANRNAFRCSFPWWLFAWAFFRHVLAVLKRQVLTIFIA